MNVESLSSVNRAQVWNYLFNKYFAPPHDRFITFVIDGIDNMAAERTRKTFYRLIKQIVHAFKESGNGPIRLICLSQLTLEDEIKKVFASHFQMPSITVTKVKNRGDIETCISWTVDQSTKLKRALKDRKFRQDTVTKLAGCTEGVFESKIYLKSDGGSLLTVLSGCFIVEATCPKGSCRFILRSP
jgi:hypothetical protein